MTAPPGWATQQLAEVLAVLTLSPDADAAVDEALERIVESFEADAGAFVRDGQVTASLGWANGQVPNAELLALSPAERTEIDVPGAGVCQVVTVPVDREDASTIVLARAELAFTAEEIGLLRGMARVLSMARRLLGTLAVERRQAEENERLVATLQQRQDLLERLARIQRLISSRAPLQAVLDAITRDAADLLGDEVVGLRLVDEADPRYMLLASSLGVPTHLSDQLHRSLVGEGIGGHAIAEDRLCIAEGYGESIDAITAFAEDGLQSAMAAPVRIEGIAAGSLVVASYRKGRRYSEAERDLLTSLAEHASLALNDARTVEAMNKALEDAMHQAMHDSLTALPNRGLFLDRLIHALARAQREPTTLAVLFIDLDNFKLVNDSRGHNFGDRLLAEVACRLDAHVRAIDTAARLGGDEFAVLLEDVTGPAEAMETARRLLAALAEPLEVSGELVVVDASIGIAIGGADDTAGDLLRNADVAMYRAKSLGRGRAALFQPEMQAAIVHRIALEADLRTAVEVGQFHLEYQPIVRTESGVITGVEALLRWPHPDRGLVPPDTFIPLAEDTGLILPLGRWVLGEACRQLREWADAGLGGEPLTMSVNVSGIQFLQAALVDDVADALASSGIDPSLLTLEITETVLMQDADTTVTRLCALKDLGVRLAIDDFGTGYSSLAYLRRFPVDVLKIDKSFIDGLTTSLGEATLVHAIVRLGHTLGLEVIAEGVEQPAQRERLEALGCGLFQGFLLARALPAAAAAKLISSQLASTR